MYLLSDVKPKGRRGLWYCFDCDESFYSHYEALCKPECPRCGGQHTMKRSEVPDLAAEPVKCLALMMADCFLLAVVLYQLGIQAGPPIPGIP